MCFLLKTGFHRQVQQALGVARLARWRHPSA
jgi:hypothetical protein